jgi:S-DNA-T family DNA segregation ATPase FtsK/SpoIIIE
MSTILQVRVGGAIVVALAGYAAVAVLSPDGAVAGVVAGMLVDFLGWLSLPWCVAGIAGGVATAAGPAAWRRDVAFRLGGAVLLLAGLMIATGVRDPLPTSDRFLDAAAGSGSIGALLREGVQSVFGSASATSVAVVVAVVGVILLAGVPRHAWRQVGAWIAPRAGWAVTHGAHLAIRGGSTTAMLLGVALRALARWAARLSATLVSATGRGCSRLWRTLTAPRPVHVPDDAFIDDWQAPHGTTLAETAPLRGRQQSHGTLASTPDGVAGGSGAAPAAVGGNGVRTFRVASGGAVREPTVPRTAAPPRSGTPDKWHLPPATMLSESAAQQLGDAEIAEKASTIQRTLGSFNIPVTVREARVGPTVTQFSLVPGEGVPVKAIKRFEYDLQLRLAAKTLRIELPVPGRPFVGIEIPNDRAASVGLREVLESREFVEHKGRLRVGLGRDVDGRPRVGDLARMPHVLIAGQTGAGKSVCLNTIIASLLCFCTPDDLNLLMIDPKQVELAEYKGIPHLRYPVVTDLAEAGKLLLWVCDEMERRYTLLSKAGFRHLDAYNRSLEAPADNSRAPDATVTSRHADPVAKALPYIVLVIDELADLMMFAPDDVEPAICRLTAKARAVGIHLVVATQRPSVNVVTGLIKANIPSRVAFAVASQTDSRVILDTGGAETLLGKGDMLYLPYDQGRPVRVQGAWVSDEELTALVKHWKDQGSPNYVSKDEIDALSLSDEAAAAEKDQARTALVDRALEAIRSTNSVSVSFLQRKLGIGYPKAAKLMDDLEDAGHVELDETTGRTYRVIDRGGAHDDIEDLVTPMAVGRRSRGGRR